jgi:hypothetical protein
MHNLVANFIKNLCIFKNFSKNLVDERRNMPRRGIAPRFSDLEVIALCLTIENFSVDSESYLFSLLEEYISDIPNLIFSCTYRNYIVTLCRLFADKDDRYTIDIR